VLRAASDAAPAGRALATQTRRVVPDRMPAAFASQERFLARRARAAQHGAVPGRAPIQPIDPVHPQPRHIARAIAVLEAGGLVSYPTDTYYAIVDNERFRLLRRLLPGPYTVILPATRVVPRTALTRQRAVGVRVPDAPVALALVHGLGRPLATTSAAVADEEPLVDARDIQDQLGHGLDLILDGGMKLNEASTVLDLSGPRPIVLRQGKGRVEGLLA